MSRCFLPGRLARPLVLLLAAVSVVVPPLAFAQASADSTAVRAPDPRTEYPYTLELWQTVETIAPGQSIRIVHDGPGVVQGWFTHHDDWDLELEGYGLVTTVPLETIDRIDFEVRDTRRAMLIGGGLGLLAALGVGLLIHSAEEDGTTNTGGVIAISLGIGIPLGLALGALLGANETRWEQAYPARD